MTAARSENVSDGKDAHHGVSGRPTKSEIIITDPFQSNTTKAISAELNGQRLCPGIVDEDNMMRWGSQ